MLSASSSNSDENVFINSEPITDVYVFAQFYTDVTSQSPTDRKHPD